MPPYASIVLLATIVVASAASVSLPLRLAVERVDADTHTGATARKGYQLKKRAESSAQVLLTVAVKLQNADQLTQTLYAVSDPASAAYGKHLSHAAVTALTRPAEASLLAVNEWLSGVGLVGDSSVEGFVTAKATVGQAEKLLSAEYWEYEHAASNTTIIRLLHGLSEPYSVPVGVATHVDFVTPTLTFPPAHTMLPRTHSSVDEKAAVTPLKLRALMNLQPSDIGKGSESKVSQGIASFIGQYYDMPDLLAFNKKYGLPEPSPKTFKSKSFRQLLPRQRQRQRRRRSGYGGGRRRRQSRMPMHQRPT